MIKKFLQRILRTLSVLVLWRYKPIVVSITGSVGKTSTKEAVYAVLRTKFKVRKSERNYNNEIGVPLTIFGEEKAHGKNVVAWLWMFIRVLFMVFWKKSDFPAILIIEIGADRPGDIKYLTGFVKQKIAVVTAVGNIPVHVEFFSGPRAVAREKRVLVETLPINGHAILNYDDETVREMKEKTKAHILDFGFGEGADIKASNYELKFTTEGEPEGMNFKVDYDGSTVPVKLNNVFGKQHVYAALGAIGAGISLGMNLVEISEALKDYESPSGRMKLIKGIKESWIIDDTYNASPISTLAALEFLKEIPAKRKIVVFGDMLEIGKYTVEAHEHVGEEASKAADFIFTVGMRAKFAYNEAISRGFDSKRIFHFNESQEAGLPLQKIIEPGDLILVKGSRAMKMEKVVLEVMAYPRRQKYLLVS